MEQERMRGVFAPGGTTWEHSTDSNASGERQSSPALELALAQGQSGEFHPRSAARRREKEGKVSGHTALHGYQENLCRLREELGVLQNIWKQIKARFVSQLFR